MCIAVYSPKGNSVPCEDYLHNCFDNNSDGAGFAFNLNGHVEIVKGFMDWQSFISAFREYDKSYCLKNRGVLIHFRIATHGKVDTANCHPFPISESNKVLSKNKCSADYACVHNGIIKLTTDDAKREQKYSDTFIFVRDYLSKIASNKGWFRNKNNIQLVEQLIDSKMAILNSKGDTISTSGFRKGPDGNYYSNDSYSYSHRFSFYDDCYFPMFDQHLMMLKRGESILFDDGDCEDYDETYPALCTRDGEVFFATDYSIFNGTVSANDLIYVGDGVFINSDNPFDENGEVKAIDFRKDIKCKGGYGYGYAL